MAYQPDLADAFAAQLSLHNAIHRALKTIKTNLSTEFNDQGGGVGFFAQCARVGAMFERWASDKVDFDRHGECWTYYLEGHFGAAVLRVVNNNIGAITKLTEADCPLICAYMQVPLLPSIFEPKKRRGRR